MTDRTGELLQAYFETGAVPLDATPEEAAEVRGLAGAAERSRRLRPHASYEANVTMPTARARFERFVAANQPAPAPVRTAVPVRRSIIGRVVGLPRGLAAAGAAAAIGVFALIAVFALQNASSTTETAAAAVLSPGDYTQIEGTITSTSGEGATRRAVVQSLLGRITVTIPEGTAILAPGESGDPGSLTTGATVLVGGLVNADRTIAAQTIAVGQVTALPGAAATVKELRQTPPPMVEGTVHLISIREATGDAILVIDTGRGRFRVPISGVTANHLLSGQPRVLGARVRAERAGDGSYSVSVVSTPRGSPADANFVHISGVVSARNANVLTVQTDRGPVLVVIRLETRILLGDSGLTLEGVRHGESAIGHTVTVQGALAPGTRRLAADVIAAGQTAPQR